MDSSLKIAIVEDNEDLLTLLIKNLSEAGYFVKGADSAEQLDELFVKQTFDLLIADINLPSENGFSIAARYKKLNPHLVILMLTARAHADDQAMGYDFGADLYLAKPISKPVLLAAIRSISKRIELNNQSPDLILNLKTLNLSGLKKVDLNMQEALIIQALINSPSRKLPYFELMEACNVPVNDAGKALLEVRITRLRKKFIEVGVEKSLRALYGDGYQLLVDVRVVT